uniref:EGF-like domain-containing protein n=1 Tax=Sparus aurata TaxID=8175 RepID=A0A671Y7H7_SPAAU
MECYSPHNLLIENKSLLIESWLLFRMQGSLCCSEILLLAAVKTYNGQYLSREVASGISVGHKKLLEAQSNVTISHITSDPCLTSPCQNGATCNKNIYISQDVAVLESTAVIFVSPQKEVFNCTCPAGFTGSLCEDDIDECEVNPCENNGTCVNALGGFYCHCLSGFSGSVCSTDVDECLKLKCQNGGTCIPTQGRYHCQCAPGFEGRLWIFFFTLFCLTRFRKSSSHWRYWTGPCASLMTWALDL